MKPALVVLAAGIGRRYGGLKQLEPVGPGGATLMDYAVYDAVRAGFGRIVFIIRQEMEATVRETLGRRYQARLPVAYAFQRLEDLPPGFALPPGRTKPWGTGQAVLATAELLREPFAVVNADDFYGAAAYRALGTFLQAMPSGPVPEYALVGFRLGETLPERGAVALAICQCTPDGYLTDIVETLGIERSGTGARVRDASGTWHALPGDQLVSMNFWGFSPALFESVRGEFRRFLTEHAGSLEAELYLPAAVRGLLRAGKVRVRVLPGGEHWCGVTNPEDKARVVQTLRELTDRGVYPPALWS